MRLVSKTRRGAVVSKRFDVARTPYRRVLESPHVPEEPKQALTQTYLGLNPAELKRQIGRCQDRLLELAKTKSKRKEVTPSPDHPFRQAFSPRQRSRTSLVRQPVGASRTS
jgi:hypothetical protein